MITKETRPTYHWETKALSSVGIAKQQLSTSIQQRPVRIKLFLTLMGASANAFFAVVSLCYSRYWSWANSTTVWVSLKSCRAREQSYTSNKMILHAAAQLLLVSTAQSKLTSRTSYTVKGGLALGVWLICLTLSSRYCQTTFLASTLVRQFASQSCRVNMFRKNWAAHSFSIC